MPKGTSKNRLDAILDNDASAEITEFNYDETVKYTKNKASEKNWILLQDSSWNGYLDIPQNIMLGYSTMVTEFIKQYNNWPTHIIVQAGVGSFAASILINFINQSKPKPKPKKGLNNRLSHPAAPGCALFIYLISPTQDDADNS